MFKVFVSNIKVIYSNVFIKKVCINGPKFNVAVMKSTDFAIILPENLAHLKKNEDNMSPLTEKNSSKTIYFVANQQRTLRGGRSSLKKTLEELEEEFSNPRVDTIIHMYCKKCSKYVTNDNNFRSSYLSQVLVGKCISKANGFLDFCHPPSKSYDCSK